MAAGAGPADDDASEGAAAAAWAQLALPEMAPWKQASDTAAPSQQPQPRRWRSLALAASAVLAVAAVGSPHIGRWLDAVSPAASASAAPDSALAADGPAATDVVLEPPPAAFPKPASSGAIAAAAPQRPRRLTAPSAQVEPFTPETPLVAASNPDPVAAAPIPVAPAIVAPEPPMGRFFEATDVDEMPRIASRVEPQVPADIASTRFNDVVVVRVLVSQSGHPFRVSLLRRSKLGASLDEAVIDAVTRWTFSPALKRGEPVSAWYNIGLPLGGGQ